MIDQIKKYCDGTLGCAEIARIVGCNNTTVHAAVKRYSLNVKMRKRPAKRSSNPDLIMSLADGKRSSADIASMTGLSAKYVQNILRNSNSQMLPRGGQVAEHEALVIDRDGYALVRAPINHPYARRVSGRNYPRILKHRLLMETMLGRYLLPTEVVDHIDGLRLHNEPDNLRLFDSNAEHLKQTISGQVPKWSAKGVVKQSLPHRQRAGAEQIHTYQSMKVNGDARLIQILLVLLKFGIDSPFLLGSHHHLQKAEISDLSHPSLERELAALYRKYA